MTDTRLDLARKFEKLGGPLATNGVGLSLGVWAGRGDWASVPEDHRAKEGQRALAELDAMVVQLNKFRQQLADEVGGHETGPATDAEDDSARRLAVGRQWIAHHGGERTGMPVPSWDNLAPAEQDQAVTEAQHWLEAAYNVGLVVLPLTGPRTVFAVSTGEYSDYRVHGAFVDRSDAQALVDRLNVNEGPDVFDLPLCAPGDRGSLVLRKVYRAEVSIKDGTIGDPRLMDAYPSGVIATEVPTEDEIVRGLSGPLSVRVTAATPDAAMKAARDKAADVLAQRHEATP